MTDIYPEFVVKNPASTCRELFSVAKMINKRERPVGFRAVVSTSLYFGTHAPHLHSFVSPTLELLKAPLDFVRQRKSWWENYFEPFLEGCAQVLPMDWVHRVHLAENLSFLVDLIPANVEIYVMQQSSWGSVPGMFWRYLPLEAGVACIARGADNYCLGDDELHVFQLALSLGTFLVRTVTNRWKDEINRFIYRTVHGPCLIKGPINFVDAASTWIYLNQKKQFNERVHAFPELRHVGMASWDNFGQDEQFLCRWAYYLAAPRSTITIVPRGVKHEMFQRDMNFLEVRSDKHSFVRW